MIMPHLFFDIGFSCAVWHSMVGKNGQGPCTVYSRDHRYILGRDDVELSPVAQNGAPDENGSQIYSRQYRVSEYATSCINICAVSRGAVSGQV